MKNQSKQDIPVIIKLVFVGDTNVGKTSLIYRQTEDSFLQDFKTTIGIEFKVKHYQVTGIKLKVQLWDTPNYAPKYCLTSRALYRGCLGVIVCFDLNDNKSFQNAQKHFKQLIAQSFPSQQTFLVGCKSDLQHKVSRQQIQKVSLCYGVVYFQTSAKEGTGVNQLIKTILGIVTPKRLQQLKNDNNSIKLIQRKKYPGERPICC